MKTFAKIFEEGKQMLRDGVAQNIRQAPYHHKEERICWQAGLLVAQEELKAEKKADAEAEAKAPPAVKHVGPPEEKPKKKGKKKAGQRD